MFAYFFKKAKTRETFLKFELNTLEFLFLFSQCEVQSLSHDDVIQLCGINTMQYNLSS